MIVHPITAVFWSTRDYRLGFQVLPRHPSYPWLRQLATGNRRNHVVRIGPRREWTEWWVPAAWKKSNYMPWCYAGRPGVYCPIAPYPWSPGKTYAWTFFPDAFPRPQ